MVSRALKARLKLCIQVWGELWRSRRAKQMIALYTVAGAVYWIAIWATPSVGSFIERRTPAIQDVLSKRSWAIVALLLLLFLVIEGFYKVKRRALRRQGSRFLSEVASLRTRLAAAEQALANSKPKLEGEIQQCVFLPYRDEVPVGDSVIEFREAGVTATLHVFFVNTNAAPTTIKHFRLNLHHAEADKTYEVRYPNEGGILRGSWDSSKPEQEQDYFYNLVDFSKTRQVAEMGQHVEGCLQFKVPGFFMSKPGDEHDGRTSVRPALIVTDAWGQEHELLYKRGVPVLPSQVVWGHTKPVVF